MVLLLLALGTEMWRERLPDCNAAKKCGAFVLKMNWARERPAPIPAAELLNFNSEVLHHGECQRMKRWRELLRRLRPKFLEYDWPIPRPDSTVRRAQQLSQS